MMRLNVKIMLGLTGVLLASGAISVRAAVPNTSFEVYKAIPERNVFGLKPPLPPAPPPDAERPQTKLTLTGITTILGRKMALLKADLPAKAGEAARDQSYLLTEGQRDGELEVIQIDEKARTVTVDNAGIVMTITFDKDSLKSPAAAAPAPAAPSAPPRPGLRTLPMRNARAANATPPTPGTAPADVPSPTGLASPPPAVAAARPAALTAEEQSLLQELEKEVSPQPAAPTPPNLPPTGLYPPPRSLMAPQ